MNRKTRAIITLIIGIAIVIMGIATISNAANAAGSYYLRSLTFGADFYTEIYNGVGEAVSAIGHFGVEISSAIGMVTLAIGLSVIAYSLKGFEVIPQPKELEKQKEETFESEELPTL